MHANGSWRIAIVLVSELLLLSVTNLLKRWVLPHPLNAWERVQLMRSIALKVSWWRFIISSILLHFFLKSFASSLLCIIVFWHILLFWKWCIGGLMDLLPIFRIPLLKHSRLSLTMSVFHSLNTSPDIWRAAWHPQTTIMSFLYRDNIELLVEPNRLL